MDNFGELKTAVNTSAGPRDDIPDHIYALALSEINRDVRITQMQETATLTVASCTTAELLAGTCDCEYTQLPADFLEMDSAYVLKGVGRQVVLPLSDSQMNDGAGTGDSHARYSITDDGIRLLDHPDSETKLYITYYKKNGALSVDTDSNVVLLNYPEMYLYLCLAHVAIWARNLEEAQAHRANYEMVRNRVMKSDIKRRVSGPLRPRNLRVA